MCLEGDVITILSAWRQAILFASGTYYEVAVQQAYFPLGIPIKLELFRGNQAAGDALNPKVYEKLAPEAASLAPSHLHGESGFALQIE